MSSVKVFQGAPQLRSLGVTRRSPRACLLGASRAIATDLPSKRHGSTVPSRSESFTIPTEDHIGYLRSVLSSRSSLLSTIDGSATIDDLAGYNNDWMNKYHGKSPIVVKPKTTNEVSEVMKYCYDRGIAIVPQGGNTGLVGGSNPIHDELVLSLSNLNQVRSFDPVSGVLVVDAGVILETADHHLADQGHIFPLDLGAKGSCQIGGVVATNAGGLRLLRYGSLHGSVLGLEVVLPDGTIWNGLSKLRKDNTGFDLKQLFIGSEGTIGIITAVSILCPRRPSAMNVAVFSLPSYEAVRKVYGEAKAQLGEILSAFEFMDRQSKLSGLLEHLMTNDMVLDGVLAQDQTQFQSLWSLREMLPEACGKAGSVYKYDLSLPLEKMYGLVESMRDQLRKGGMLDGDGKPEGPIRAVTGYGHMGDGNLHINIVADIYSDKIESLIEPFIYQAVADNDGSISAEHGLGLMKAPYISYSKSATSIDLMRKMKHVFDPKGLLNPYKYVL